MLGRGRLTSNFRSQLISAAELVRETMKMGSSFLLSAHRLAARRATMITAGIRELIKDIPFIRGLSKGNWIPWHHRLKVISPGK